MYIVRYSKVIFNCVSLTISFMYVIVKYHRAQNVWEKKR